MPRLPAELDREHYLGWIPRRVELSVMVLLDPLVQFLYGAVSGAYIFNDPCQRTGVELTVSITEANLSRRTRGARREAGRRELG